jgi:glycosyltransferase involved in cell wall biosynthesis
MRIALLSVSSQIGGAEVVLLQIVRELSVSRAAWDVHLVAPGPGPLVDRAVALGAQVTLLPMPASLLRLGEWAAGGGRAALATRLVKVAVDLPAYERALSDTLNAIRPDVVHSNGLKSHVTASRARYTHGRVLWHIHDYVGLRPITRSLLRRYAGRCAAIVANSESVAQDVTSAIRPPVAVRTIHNGVDLERFSPDGEASNLDAAASVAAPPPGTIRVGLVATFSRWKGHETFLRAIAALPRELPVRAYVVGAALYDTVGSQYTDSELREFASALGIADRVAFTGYVPEVNKAMRALDVVVHASIGPEPFGLVVAEAMACGRAVVTSATGGVAEIVRDDVDALTHAPGDHAGLADRIARLAGDASLRARLGQAARLAAVDRFDARRFGEAFAAVYEELIRGPEGRA